MTSREFRAAILQVGRALREPEEFTQDWHNGRRVYEWRVWFALILTAMAGTTAYGMSMGIGGGVPRILFAGFSCTLAAGLAWGIPLPALYILNSMAGSKLPVSSTVLAALVTTSWGGLAMIASIPVNWFFITAVPHSTFALSVNLVVFTGVGVAMADVFGRVMQQLEPSRGRAPVIWLLLVAAIGTELFVLLGLFDFTALAAPR